MFEPTIKDIAKICGVGVSTVSRAINDHPDINSETKEKIMNAIQEYGYVPNDSARNLKRVDAKAIAVLVKGIANPFFTGMITVIEQECKKRHYSMELSHVEADENEVDVAQKVVKEKRLRGIIFLGGRFSHSEEKLKKLTVPFVFSTAGSIPENISRKLYSSIAILVAEVLEESVGRLRLDGYCDALKAHGIEVNPGLICHTSGELGHFSMENGYLTTKRLLGRGEAFTALYAVSDTLAIGSLRALYEAGLRVPQDISLAGYDGIDMAGYTVPNLTTMRQPVEEMARDTTRLLFDIIAKKTKHQHITYEAELLARESTAEIPE